MTQHTMADRIVRYGELVPCKTAIIDAHTPGSDQKENFTIIGPFTLQYGFYTFFIKFHFTVGHYENT